jgi:hypothetical protein
MNAGMFTGFGKVSKAKDISGIASDYLLQPGEIVSIKFANTTVVPLRIATVSGCEYEITIQSTTLNFTANSSTQVKSNNIDTGYNSVMIQGVHSFGTSI